MIIGIILIIIAYFILKAIFSEAEIIQEKKIISTSIHSNLDFDFSSVDIETINNNGGIVSIGVCYFKNNKVIKTYYSKVKPIDSTELQKAVLVHGITYESVRHERTFDKVWKDIEDILTKPIIGHNIINFDIVQIQKALIQCGINLSGPVDVADTLNISKNIIITGSYKLNKLCKILDINLEHHHNALDDAEAAGYLYIKLSELHESGKTLTIEEPFTEEDFVFNKDYIKNNPNSSTDYIYSGKCICITGIPETFATKDLLQKYLYDKGCNISKSITKSTDILVTCLNPSQSKISKAKENNLLILTESEL